MAIKEYDQKGGINMREIEYFKKVQTPERCDSGYSVGLENVSNSSKDTAI